MPEKNYRKMHVTWKITAIIFIILFILETLFTIWAYSIGTKEIENETKCQADICGKTILGVNEYTSFFYEDNICYCYKNGEIAYQEYIK